MTYQEWADDYLNEANKIKGKINEIKEQMPLMPVQALQLAERRIQVLYSMYIDTLHTYKILSGRTGAVF